MKQPPGLVFIKPCTAGQIVQEHFFPYLNDHNRSRGPWSVSCTDRFDWFKSSVAYYGSVLLFKWRCYFGPHIILLEIFFLLYLVWLSIFFQILLYTCISVFQGNIFLTTVDLSYNGFSKEGAVALGQALKENNVLEELNLRYQPLLYQYLIIGLWITELKVAVALT